MTCTGLLCRSIFADWKKREFPQTFTLMNLSKKVKSTKTNLGPMNLHGLPLLRRSAPKKLP